MISSKKIAKILGTDKDTLSFIDPVVLDRIVGENERIIKEKLEILGVKTRNAKEISRALLNKAWEDDVALTPGVAVPATPGVAGKGFFIKIEKAKEFLRDCPPQNILKTLGYKNVDELLKNEDLFEIYAALRFVEEEEWLNEVFFKQYESLTPDDFEEREIRQIVLSEKWKKVAEEFVKKKYHNVSHLKELGVIFVLPATLGIKGEKLRTSSLIFHYFHEIDFYCKLFRKYADEKGSFAEKFISALRGDVIETSDVKNSKTSDVKRWLIIQRYLAKDDKNDWRLFVPHVNPEAIYWRKAERGLNLSFWKDLDWVGDYFNGTLVSFNLVDTAMSLVKKKEMVKYLYHHQEALWNKIFSEIVGGEEKMEKLILENFEKGYIKIQNSPN